MGQGRNNASRHEKVGSITPVRRPSRANFLMRRFMVGGGIVTALTALAVKLESGSDKSTEKVTFNDGNVVLVDKKGRSAEIDTKALGITNPGDAAAREAGQAITVKCVDYHPAPEKMKAGDTLTELVIEETATTDPQIPSSAVADSVAAFNDITGPDGNIDASFAQEGAIYEVPQLCSIDG